MRKRSLVLLLIALVILFASVFLFVEKANAEGIEPHPLNQNEQIIEQQSQQVQQKSIILQNTSQEVQTLEQKKQELAQKLADEQTAIADLKQKIANKRVVVERAKAQPVAQPVAQTASVPVGYGPMSGCGDNQYAAYIYGMESGGHVVGNCNPSAINGGGCRGIGQACPGSKLLAVCPNLDYACENAFFTDYANKYGGWAGAYQFWLGHGWW